HMRGPAPGAAPLRYSIPPTAPLGQHLIDKIKRFCMPPAVSFPPDCSFFQKPPPKQNFPPARLTISNIIIILKPEIAIFDIQPERRWGRGPGEVPDPDGADVLHPAVPDPGAVRGGHHGAGAGDDGGPGGHRPRH